MWVNARPHPGPLPQERENQLQSAGVASAPWNFVGQPLLFPLPEGEGQGGEPCSLNSPNSPCSTKTLPFSSHYRLLRIRLPRPRVAKPELRQEMDRSRFRLAIVNRHAHQNVFRPGLGVFYE